MTVECSLLECWADAALKSASRAQVENLLGSRWLVEACKVRGYGYSPRLHILLWGAKRGV